MIWKKDFKIDDLNQEQYGHFINPFDIEYIEKGDDYLIARMPVAPKTLQPMGLLHGGVSVYLAESIGSFAGHFCLDNEKKTIVGLEINANHIRGVKKGYVYAKAKAIHIGGKTHVWSIEITNEEKKMVCVCRLTLAVIAI